MIDIIFVLLLTPVNACSHNCNQPFADTLQIFCLVLVICMILGFCGYLLQQSCRSVNWLTMYHQVIQTHVLFSQAKI
jgi:hypothetical protein